MAAAFHLNASQGKSSAEPAQPREFTDLDKRLICLQSLYLEVGTRWLFRRFPCAFSSFQVKKIAGSHRDRCSPVSVVSSRPFRNIREMPLWLLSVRFLAFSLFVWVYFVLYLDTGFVLYFLVGQPSR